MFFFCRQELFQSLVTLCVNSPAGFSLDASEKSRLTSLDSLPQFLMREESFYRLTTKGLPQDQYSRQSASIVYFQHGNCWPLIVDPQGMATHWLQVREKGALFVDFRVSLADPTKNCSVKIFLPLFSVHEHRTRRPQPKHSVTVFPRVCPWSLRGSTPRKW